MLSGAYSRVLPVPVRAPKLLAVAPEVAELVGFQAADYAQQEFAQVFGGNALLQGMEPFAACYGGHQFGTWAGQLGDGRAMSLGEVLQRGQRWELQLKGAGRTPYSRGADGRAVLRSSIREFICSEAMHHLGVPTTRALCLVGTGDAVVRDMLYDGHPREEPGAIVCRVAPSFVRFGNFELFASRGQHQLLQQLLDYVIATHFPELGSPSPAVYATWLAEVARRTGELIAEWMRVGFTHGVMNTDNLSVLGLTIDYGPFGFLDNFDPNFTPNTTDAERRRYRYGQQPRVARWNLSKLAEALYPLIREVPPLEAALDVYEDTFLAAQRRTLAAKLGLRALANEDDGEAEAPTSDTALVQSLFELLSATETDFTLFFQGLAQLELPRVGHAEERELLAPLAPAYYSSEPLPRDVHERTLQFLRRYAERIASEHTSEPERRERMQRANPIYIPRNYLLQEAIDAAEAGDTGPLLTLLDVSRNPYTLQTGREHFAEKRPDWARSRVGCSMLSCSS